MKNFKVFGFVSLLSLSILAGCASAQVKVDRLATGEETQQIQRDLEESKKRITSITSEGTDESDDSANYQSDAEKFATKRKATARTTLTFYDSTQDIVSETQGTIEENTPVVSYSYDSTTKSTTSLEVDATTSEIRQTLMTDLKNDYDQFATKTYQGNVLGSSTAADALQTTYETQKIAQVNSAFNLTDPNTRVFKAGESFLYVTESIQQSANSTITKSYTTIKIDRVNDLYSLSSYEITNETYLTVRGMENINPALLQRNTQKGTISYDSVASTTVEKASYADYLKYQGLNPTYEVYYLVENSPTASDNGWHPLTNLSSSLFVFARDSSYSASNGTNQNRFQVSSGAVTTSDFSSIFNSGDIFTYRDYVTAIGFVFYANDGTTNIPLTNVTKQGTVLGDPATITPITGGSLNGYSYPMTYAQIQQNTSTTSLFNIEVTYPSLNAAEGTVTFTPVS